MTKVELVKTIQENLKIEATQAEVKDFLDAFEKTVVDAVCDGDKVALTGFVSFEARDTAPRTARNPQSGEVIDVPASKKVAVKIGKAFKDAVKATV